MNPATDMTDRVLGESAGTIRLESRAEVRAACSLMAAQVTRELCIFSHDLDAPLYDHSDFLKTVRGVALRSPRALVHVLLFDPEPPVRKCHRIVELARQLSSRIHIRRVPEELQNHTQTYLLADDRGYVLRPLADVFEGTADFSAPLEVRRMREQFEQIWQRSEEPIELRAFGRGL